MTIRGAACYAFRSMVETESYAQQQAVEQAVVRHEASPRAQVKAAQTVAGPFQQAAAA